MTRTGHWRIASSLAALAALVGTARGGVFLRETQSVSGDDLRGVSAAALSPDGRHLYVASERLFAFSRDSASGALLLVESQLRGVCVAGTVGAGCERDNDCDVMPSDGECFQLLDNVRSLTVSPDGVCTYAAAAREDTIAAFDRDPTSGALTLASHVQNETCAAGQTGAACDADADCDTGPGTGDGICLLDLRDPRSLAFSPDGTHLYVAANIGNSVLVFTRLAPGCDLTFVQRIVQGAGPLRGLRQAWDVAVDASGEHVYVIGLFGNAILVFDRDAGTGMLTLAQSIIAAECTAGNVGVTCRADDDCHTAPAAKDGVCTVSVPALLAPKVLRLSPDGKQVYVAALSGIAVFDRDAGTGQVTLLDLEQLGPSDLFREATSLAVSPDGATVYLGHTGAFGMLTLERDSATGLLRPFSHALFSGSVVSPDSAFVYAGGATGGLTVYSVEPAVECSPTPLAGCRQPTKPGKAVLQVKDGVPDVKDKLSWKWAAGAATALSDFGDPATQTSFALCVYDAAADDQPRLSFRLVPGSSCAGKQVCWAGTPKAFKYKSKPRFPDGLEKATLGSGLAGEAKLTLKGKGERLALAPLGLSPPLRVQLQAANGICWEATYSTLLANTPMELKAKSD